SELDEARLCKVCDRCRRNCARHDRPPDTEQCDRAMIETTYRAVRLTYDSNLDFNEARARFDERVPAFEDATSIKLVLGVASWSDVQAAVDARAGPTGLVALSRLDQGALLSL